MTFFYFYKDGTFHIELMKHGRIDSGHFVFDNQYYVRMLLIRWD